MLRLNIVCPTRYDCDNVCSSIGTPARHARSPTPSSTPRPSPLFSSRLLRNLSSWTSPLKKASRSINSTRDGGLASIEYSVCGFSPWWPTRCSASTGTWGWTGVWLCVRSTRGCPTERDETSWLAVWVCLAAPLDSARNPKADALQTHHTRSGLEQSTSFLNRPAPTSGRHARHRILTLWIHLVAHPDSERSPRHLLSAFGPSSSFPIPSSTTSLPSSTSSSASHGLSSSRRICTQ